MSEDIISKTNSSIIYRFIWSGGQQVVALVLGILLARILSPTEFGVVAIANLIIFYANSFTNFGLNNALVQKKRVDINHINTVFTLDLLISSVLAFSTLLSADWLARLFNNPEIAAVLRWMSLYYVITSFYHIPVVILRRNIDFRYLSIVEFIQGLMTSLLAIILALLGYSYWAIIISSLTMPTIFTFVLATRTRWLPRFNLYKDMGEIYSFGFWGVLRSQVELLVSKVDYFVIGKYLDISSLGLYEKSFELTNRAMSGLTMPLNAVFFSTYCRLKDDSVEIQRVFLDSTKILSLICLPALFGLIGVAPHFVMSCLGTQWEATIIPIQILATACVFRSLLCLVASLNVAIGKYKAHTILTIFSASVFIALCFYYAKDGIFAISFCFLVYCTLSFLSGFMLLCFNTEIKVFDLISSIWCPFVGAVGMMIFVILLRTFYANDYSSFFQFIFLISAGAVFYTSWCYYFYCKGLIILRLKVART